MDEYGRRKTPPETEEEHAYLWDSADKAQKAWRIAAPIHAVTTNVKGISVLAGLILLIVSLVKGEEISALIIKILGG